MVGQLWLAQEKLRLQQEAERLAGKKGPKSKQQDNPLPAHFSEPPSLGSGVLTLEAVRKVLEHDVKEAGGLAAWASAHGLNAETVRHIMKGRREMSDGVLSALGYVMVPTYVRV